MIRGNGHFASGMFMANYLIARRPKNPKKIDEAISMSEHLIEMAGARVLVKDGQIEVLSEPTVKRCPLRQNLYGIEEESKETVEQVLRAHMKDLGMYGPSRVLELDRKPVSFGASEMITDGMAEGLVDSAVVVCEGAGTVIVSRPEIFQALGAHMTGLIRTEPIEDTQNGLEAKGCILLDRKGTLDQVKGYEKAIEAGFEKVAVTITGLRAFEAKQLREKSLGENSPIIFAVHNTGIDEEQARVLAENCDVVWSCASRWAREIVGKCSKIQIGISIPVYALTKTGKRLVLNRAYHFEDGLVLHRANLPYTPEEKQPKPLL